MYIGVPREIAPQEGRVGLVPSAVKVLVDQGHHVLLEQGAGMASGLFDNEYIRAGAELVRTAEDVYAGADLLWKICPPTAPEFEHLRPGQILFSFLHLAARPRLLRALLDSEVVALGMETIQLDDGSLPLLRPMSEVAGRLAIQVGARLLEQHAGGRGVLLGGVPGVAPGRVAVLGCGTVGLNAVRMAVGMGAEVMVLDHDLTRLRATDDQYKGQVKNLFAQPHNLESALIWADLVVAAVQIPGAPTPTLVSRGQLGLMQPGAVVVDVSVTQGGCFESSRPTTHADPTYLVDGIQHYAVPNMAGTVARTSTFALANPALHYGLELANLGWESAIAQDGALARGLNVARGRIEHARISANV